MTRALSTASILFAILLVGGCNSSGFKDDGIPSSNKAAAASANAIAISVGGDYDKLTPDQKKQFLDLAGGHEQQARRMMNLMAHPPVHGAAGGAGGPASGPHPPGNGG